MNKHYTFQEYLEKFSSIQDSYDYYFELQKEIDRLTENNQAMQEEMARTWKKLDEKENIIKEVREYIEALKIEDYDSNAYFIQDKYDKWLGIEEIPNKLLEILEKENLN